MSSQLIEANKAFFAGDRAEVRRILADYRRDNPNDFEQAQWLEAHAQDDYEDLIRGLHLLIEHGQPESRYVKMARDYLNEEYDLREQLQPKRNNNRIWIIGGIFATIVLLIVIFGFPQLFGASASDQLLPTATLDPILLTNPTAVLTDNSQTLIGDNYTARYTRGIIQINAIENRSQRVVAQRNDSLITPVPGARFVALSLIFECRDGICRQPPEADLFLQLDNGDLAPIRTDVYINDVLDLQPVALGRTTEGWLIFEVPVLNRPIALVIRPFADDSGTRAPDITIQLPTF